MKTQSDESLCMKDSGAPVPVGMYWKKNILTYLQIPGYDL